MTDELWQLSACDLAEGIRRKAFSSVEVMESVVGLGYYEQMHGVADSEGYMLGIADRARMIRAWSVFLDDHPLVVTPFFMLPVFPWNYDVQGFAQTKDLFDAGMYSHAMNYLGVPAGVVPVGLVEGLPAGIQIVSRRFREDLILDAMTVVEREVGVMARTLWARRTTPV